MTYSSSLSMSRQQRLSASTGTARRNQNAVDFRTGRKVGLGPVSNTVMLIVLACLLGLLYLTQVTKTNAYGFQLQTLSDQQTALTDEHNDLELQAARNQSLDKVRASPQATAMVPVTPSGTVQN